MHLTFSGRQNGAMQGLFAEKSDVVSLRTFTLVCR